MMKLMFVTGRMSPPLFFGGAEISARILACQLDRAGYSIFYLGSYSHPRNPGDETWRETYLKQLAELGIEASSDGMGAIHYRFGNIACRMVQIQRLLDEFSRCTASFSVRAVITMLEGAPAIIRACRTRGLRSIAWIHDVYPVGLEPLFERPSGVMYTSNFVRKIGVSASGTDGLVFYPPFEPPGEDSIDERRDGFITMINPVPEKGGRLFLELASQFPERRFLAVEGWRHSELWEGLIPSNVVYWPKHMDMDRVWRETRILVVPSVIDEGFGRVVVEAGIRGVPSIVSMRGGLTEAAGEGAIFISNDSVEDWGNALKWLDAPSHWEKS